MTGKPCYVWQSVMSTGIMLFSLLCTEILPLEQAAAQALPGSNALPLPPLTPVLPNHNVGTKRLPGGEEERFCFPTISPAIVSHPRRGFREAAEALN